MLSSGKTLTEPILLLLLLALIASAVSFLRSPRKSTVRRHSLVVILALAMLWILATPAAARLLDHSIRVSDGNRGAPAFIIVPSSGSIALASDTGPLLSSNTAARLEEAIRWWKTIPAATLVFSGGDTTPDGTIGETVNAMRAEAIRRGVPAGSILLEVHSRNTREHAIELARTIAADTPIGLVSNGWHLRRARLAFARHFSRIAVHPCDRSEDTVTSLSDLIPSSWGLLWSTIVLHEWIGIAWYALRS
jgi:uncharacterized SAM-binding protein YcdF (DUF218 family)